MGKSLKRLATSEGFGSAPDTYQIVLPAERFSQQTGSVALNEVLAVASSGELLDTRNRPPDHDASIISMHFIDYGRADTGLRA